MTFLRTNIAYASAALLMLAATGCKNGNVEFEDFEGGVSAYFAYQSPVRCVVLGEWPDGDNSLDLQHKVMPMATQGGAYETRDLRVSVVVDPTLCDGLTFPDGRPVKVMPESYYNLETTTFTKVKDYLFGGTVSLSDAFFADPESVRETYVIPLRITKADGADRILTGTPLQEGTEPARTDASAWSVRPQDYMLYCVKYVNPWTASYCRRGVDQVVDAVNGTSTVVRHAQYVEKDEVVFLTTKSMSETIFPVSTVVPDGESVKTLTCNLNLAFNGEDCTVTTATEGMTASGTGKFVKRGDKHSINNEDRDVIYLDYTVNFGPRSFTTKDTLVVRSREIAPQYDFNPTYNK